MDVQDEAIPLILGGGDVMVDTRLSAFFLSLGKVPIPSFPQIAAPTGHGKTGAFAIPMLQLIHESLRGSSFCSLHLPSFVWTHTHFLSLLGEAETSTKSSSTTLQVIMNADDRSLSMAVSTDGLVVQVKEPLS
jgi:ATP-dependent RNA helicase DDX1